MHFSVLCIPNCVISGILCSLFDATFVFAYSLAADMIACNLQGHWSVLPVAFVSAQRVCETFFHSEPFYVALF